MLISFQLMQKQVSYVRVVHNPSKQFCSFDSFLTRVFFLFNTKIQKNTFQGLYNLHSK